jgi:hypothetical protein
VEGFDYGEGGYDPNKGNVGFNEETGQFHIEIKGLAEPKSKEAARICTQDLNEVIAAFVQDKTAIERGLFDEELIPEELTQVRMGKIIKDKYPELTEEDQEAVRQHAIAALNITQQAKQIALGGNGGGNGDTEQRANPPDYAQSRAKGHPRRFGSYRSPKTYPQRATEARFKAAGLHSDPRFWKS